MIHPAAAKPNPTCHKRREISCTFLTVLWSVSVKTNLPSHAHSSPHLRRARGTRAAGRWEGEAGRRCSRLRRRRRRCCCCYSHCSRCWSTSCPQTAAGCRLMSPPASAWRTSYPGTGRCAAGGLARHRRSRLLREQLDEGPHSDLTAPGREIQSAWKSDRRNAIPMCEVKSPTFWMHVTQDVWRISK